MQGLQSFITSLSVFSCVIASCTAFPVRFSEDDYSVMRRLGLLADGPLAAKSETFDVLDLDHLAERVIAQGGAVSISQLQLAGEQQSLSSRPLADRDQPKSRQVRALRHGHSSNDFDIRHRFVAKSKDGYKNAAYYAPSVRWATPSQPQPSAERQRRGLFIKRSGSSARGGIVVPIRRNRQVLRVLPISTNTRQSRLRALERGDH